MTYERPKNPADLERDLESLRRANQEATRWVAESENEYEHIHGRYVIALERARLGTWRDEDDGMKWTESRRNAYATVATEDLRIALASAAAKQRAARARAAGIRVDADLVRSQCALMRSALELT